MKKKKIKTNPVFAPYDSKSLQKDIEKALNKYRKMHNTKADKIKETKITLPTILYKGKKIDLDKKYKGATIVATQAGILGGLLYFQNKDGKDGIYLHITDTPRVLLTSDNGKSMFICEDGKVMVNETGVII